MISAFSKSYVGNALSPNLASNAVKAASSLMAS
jgi:hypothetical protein